MSIVAARVYHDRIEMASDGLTRRGSGEITSSVQKVIQPTKDILIGTVGKSQNRYIVERLIKEDKFDFSDRKPEDVAWDFALDFRKFSQSVKNEFSDETNFLFAYKNELYYINRLSITREYHFSAIGSGRKYAYGVLEMGGSPKDAVEITSKYHEYCGGGVFNFVINREQ